GGLSYLLLGVLLFAQNAMFQMGLLNYLFGAGAGLWLLAAWIASARMHWLLRWLAFSLGSAAVYCFHLSGFGIFCIGVVAHETGALRRARRPWTAVTTWRPLLLAFAALIPIAVVHLTLADA